MAEKRGAYKRPAPKETLLERMAKIEGRLDALADAFSDLTSRVEKAEGAIAGPKDPEPRPPFR